jgi:glycosyltransferase involved in cell wall biosynthesis
MNKSLQLISIITANYNGEKFIAQTIESVLNQSYQNWEMIIIDDCSNDKSIEIIKKYQLLDSRIKLIALEKNSGAAVARNYGIDKVKGDFIAFLDGDDLWKEDKLEKQITFMEKNNYPFTFSAYDIISEKNRKITTFNPPKKVNYNDLLKTCSIGCLTVIYNVKYFGKMYMPNILKGQDYCLWLNLLKKVDYAYSFPEPLTKYRILQNSISRNKFKKAYYQWYIYQKVEKLNFFKSVYYFTHYAFYGYIKNKKIL